MERHKNKRAEWKKERERQLVIYLATTMRNNWKANIDHNYIFEIDDIGFYNCYGFPSGVILFLPVHKARKCPCAVCKPPPHWFLYLLIVSCEIAKSRVSLQRGQDAFVFPQLNATIARCWPTNPPMWFTWKPFKGALYVSTLHLNCGSGEEQKFPKSAKSWGRWIKQMSLKRKQMSLKRKHILLWWDIDHNTLSKKSSLG